MTRRAVACLCVFLSAFCAVPAHAADGKLAPFGSCRKDGQGRVPASLDQALVELSRLLGTARLAEFKRQGPARHHFGLGTALRNCWGLWSGGSALGQWFAARGIRHPDDMSSIVLESLHRQLHGKPRDLDAQIKAHQDYWNKQREAEKRGTHSDQVLFNVVPFDKGKGWVSVKGERVPSVHDFFAKVNAHARAAVRACWSKAPQTPGRAAVDTVVRVALDKAGRLASAEVARSALPKAHAECMARALVGARSPAHAGGRYTLVLQSYRK